MTRWGPSRQAFTVSRYENCYNCAKRVAIPVPVEETGKNGTFPPSEYRYYTDGGNVIFVCSRKCEVEARNGRVR